MIFFGIAALLLIACIGLIRAADNFQIDASPVGSMMILVALGSGVCSVFFVGLAVGRLL